MIRVVCTFALVFALAQTTARADEPFSASAVLAAIDEVRLEDAEASLAALPRARAQQPDAVFLRGVLSFLRGRYTEALADVDASLPNLPPDLAASARARREPIAAAARRTRDFATLTSADGRYIVRFDEADRVLAPYALEHLRASDVVLTELLGYRHPGPVRVEFYGDVESLSEVSTLPASAIETTGTIAICKFDRLMITSPRVLTLGYGWAETMSHELVHLLLSRATRERAPVWFHEGVAKFLQSAPYYGHARLVLNPFERKVLHDRVVANDLLPFDRFHPSIALLPTPEDAALAYAEAATVIAAFHGRFGTAGLRSLLDAIADGKESRSAMSEQLGMDFEAFATASYAPARRDSPPRDAVRERRRPGGSGDDEADARPAAATRHLRLGDMLWSRGRALAASREYGRAVRHAPDDAMIVSRLGRSALEGGDGSAALEAAERALRIRPEHGPSRALRAAAFARLERRREAMLAAYDALRYNPFDPSPHCVLAEVSDDATVRERERELCRELAPAGHGPSR